LRISGSLSLAFYARRLIGTQDLQDTSGDTLPLRQRPVSEMMRYINKFKSDFGGNIISLERVQPSLDHVPHRYLLAEAGDTLFATFIGTNQYK
jgi:hypothetical protein